VRDALAIDLNLLRSLSLLLEERSVTRAAARLHITQPSLSARLARLRDLLGDPLLVPSGRHLVPTARAMAMAGGLRRALEQLEATLASTPFDPATSTRVFAIAASDYSQLAIVTPLLERLREAGRGIRVDVRTLNASTMADQLDRDEISLALTLPSSARPKLHSRRLFDEHYVCLVRKGHPLAIGRLTLDRMCRHDHLVVSPRGGAFADELDQSLAAASLSRRVTSSVQSFLLAPMIVARTDLVALVPSRVGALGRDDLIALPLPLASKGFTIAAMWHERTHRDEGHRWIRGLVHEVATAGVYKKSPAPLRQTEAARAHGRKRP
jgi:DNA-binding transcriptional LysR family regulator